jgi:toxin ParE1/3/4
MLVELTSSAQLDVAEAALSYELERSGLGNRFETELEATLNRIADGPRHFQVVGEDVRRALLRTFPFGVFFVIFPDKVSVIAVLHHHRHPDTWKLKR